ncbi:MAG TPA: ABC transporter permease [Blastocatellia bacterium]|nr:ABC transporter permease [Blastocatellia bacterium]
MIKHLFKMVWNRKRTNFLITVEIFISFLVLFAVMVLAVYYTDNYRQPLGFNYENVWSVEVNMQGGAATPEQKQARLNTLKQLFASTREFDEIESAALAETTPYSGGSSSTNYDFNGRALDYEINTVTDSFKEVMGLTLVAGRWFGREDDGVSFRPLVINERLARAAFGDEDPLGKSLQSPTDKTETRVIGVVTDFRKDGEFAGPGGYCFERYTMTDPKAWMPQTVMLKVRPNTTAALEERLIDRFQAIARDWSFDIQPVAEVRETVNGQRLAPVITAGLVAGFLMIMVALGLTGVLWQNVTQRTREIGLRRAKGATARKIHSQILGELLVITTFGLLAGVAVVMQFPLLDLVAFISAKVYAVGLVLSLALIYLLTILCGLYPSRLATRVHPAEALHYE